MLHPIWLRNRSQEAGQVEATNRQRLFTPLDVAVDLRVVECDVAGDALVTSFSDGHTARLDLDELAIALGWRADAERPPAPEPWTTPIDPFPYVDWNAIGWSVEEADPVGRARLPDRLLPLRVRGVPQHARRGGHGAARLRPPRLHLRQQLRLDVRRARRAEADRPRLHADQAAGAHRPALPATGAGHPAPALPPQRGAGRRLHARRRPRRGRGAGRGRPCRARGAGRVRDRVPLRHGDRHRRHLRPGARVRRQRAVPPDPAQHQARRPAATAGVRPRRLLPRAALAQRVAQRPRPPGDVPARAGRCDVRRQLPRAARPHRVRRHQGRAPPARRVHRPRRAGHDVPPRRATAGDVGESTR